MLDLDLINEKRTEVAPEAQFALGKCQAALRQYRQAFSDICRVTRSIELLELELADESGTCSKRRPMAWNNLRKEESKLDGLIKQEAQARQELLATHRAFLALANNLGQSSTPAIAERYRAAKARLTRQCRDLFGLKQSLFIPEITLVLDGGQAERLTI